MHRGSVNAVSNTAQKQEIYCSREYGVTIGSVTNNCLRSYSLKITHFFKQKKK